MERVKQQMSSTALDHSGGAIYEVALRNGVWQVTCDGVLFGHYRGRGAAIQAARGAAQLPASRIAGAQVVICEDDMAGPPARRS